MLTAENIKNAKIKECFLTFYNSDQYKYSAKKPLKKGEIIFPNEYKLIKQEALDEP